LDETSLTLLIGALALVLAITIAVFAWVS